MTDGGQTHSGRLVFDDPDNRRQDCTCNTTAYDLTYERAEVDRACGLCEQRNECGEKLATDAAPDCTGNRIAYRAQAHIFRAAPATLPPIAPDMI
jgi:hypothetical protein